MNEELEIDKVMRIRHFHVKQYISMKIKEGCTSSYINSIIKVLRVFFKFCEEEEYISVNPMKKVSYVKEEQKVINVFTDDEVKSMLNVYKYSSYLDARNKTILALMFDTGIRTTECIQLLNSDIQNDRIFIKGKGKKERFVPVSIKLKKYLKRYERIKEIYFKNKEIPENYFLSRTGKPLTVEAIERIFKITGEQANIRKNIRCSPHTARHYFAIKMLEYNDVFTVSKLLGHSKLDITLTYLRSLTSEQILDKTKISSPLMKL